MKVSTDACLFGAWVAASLHTPKQSTINNLLDIGTGTGLLTLMLAQKIVANIDAIELDAKASEQADENTHLTTWKDRINVINGDIKTFNTDKKYDLILSNPPFFENHLRSERNEVNMARHDTALTLEELLEAVNRTIATTGSFAVLLPFCRADYFIELATAWQLHLHTRVNIKQSVDHDNFRSILHFERTSPLAEVVGSLAIKDKNAYTAEFKTLLKDYYLFL